MYYSLSELFIHFNISIDWRLSYHKQKSFQPAFSIGNLYKEHGHHFITCCDLSKHNIILYFAVPVFESLDQFW